MPAISDLSNYKLLIGAGVEKCGTTSLHALLEDRPGFSTARRKETRFFSQHYGRGLDYYLSLYGLTPGAAQEDWLVDISPAYFRSRNAYRRIIEARPRAVTAVFLIRNPVRRAFSQYWHDIFNHITRAQEAWGGRFRDFSFEALLRQRNRYYFTPYAKEVARFRETFGEEGIVAVFEEVIRKPAGFLSALSDRTGISFPRETALPQANETNYARLELSPEGRLERIGPHKRIALKLSDEAAQNLLAIQGTFSHFVEAERCEEIFAAMFAEDVARLEEMMGRPLDDLRRQRPLVSPLWKRVNTALETAAS